MWYVSHLRLIRKTACSATHTTHAKYLGRISRLMMFLASRLAGLCDIYNMPVWKPTVHGHRPDGTQVGLGAAALVNNPCQMRHRSLSRKRRKPYCARSDSFPLIFHVKCGHCDGQTGNQFPTGCPASPAKPQRGWDLSPQGSSAPPSVVRIPPDS